MVGFRSPGHEHFRQITSRSCGLSIGSTHSCTHEYQSVTGRIPAGTESPEGKSPPSISSRRLTSGMTSTGIIRLKHQSAVCQKEQFRNIAESRNPTRTSLSVGANFQKPSPSNFTGEPCSIPTQIPKSVEHQGNLCPGVPSPQNFRKMPVSHGWGRHDGARGGGSGTRDSTAGPGTPSTAGEPLRPWHTLLAHTLRRIAPRVGRVAACRGPASRVMRGSRAPISCTWARSCRAGSRQGSQGNGSNDGRHHSPGSLCAGAAVSRVTWAAGAVRVSPSLRPSVRR